MYKLIKYIGKDGTNKLDTIDAIHSLEGIFYWPPTIGRPIGFAYDDDSGKILYSSIVEKIVTVNNQIIITTKNSIFLFEELEV